MAIECDKRPAYYFFQQFLSYSNIIIHQTRIFFFKRPSYLPQQWTKENAGTRQLNFTFVVRYAELIKDKRFTLATLKKKKNY